MDSHNPIATVAQALRRVERILIIIGADLSADSGMPTYHDLGGPYNGRTEEGLPIEAALPGPMLRRDPALCWKCLAELGRACLAARPNAGHEAIAELQKHKPECRVLTQNIDGFHRQAGSPAERLIEIHGELAPLYCQSCGAESDGLEEHLHGQLPPRCAACGRVLRLPVVLFEEMLPEKTIDTLYRGLRKGFDAVLVAGTIASFPYIVESVLRARQTGGFTAEVNPGVINLSEWVDVKTTGQALDIIPQMVSRIYR